MDSEDYQQQCSYGRYQWSIGETVGYHQNTDLCLHCHCANIYVLLLLNVTLLTQLIQSSILFDDLATGVVDDGVKKETVVVRGEDGVPTHSTVNEEELSYVSKPEVSKDEPGSNLSNNDGQELGLNAQVNVDVSTLVHGLLVILGHIFLTPFAS